MASEAAFPKTEVGVIEVKTLPAGVLIESRATGDYFASSGDLFRPLFRYISDRDIGMTVPVEAEMQPGVMRFWIAESEVSKAQDATEIVKIVHAPERTVASLGLRGGYSEENYREAKAQLDAWLAAQSEWQATGPASMVFWNSPMVPWFLKRSEIHQPVTKTVAEPKLGGK